MLHKEIPVLNIAHRGSKPENRMLGFIKAAKIGCHMIECDIRLSRDGFPMVIHDKTIDRTTPNGYGIVSDMTRSELEKFSIPSFQELTQWIVDHNQQHLQIAVEVKNLYNNNKNQLMIQYVVDILKKQSLVDRSILISFNKNMVKFAKESCPELTTAIILPIFFQNPFQLCNTYKSDHLWMYHRLISKHLIETAKIDGKKIFAWTVNDHNRIRTLCQMGVDGIITDHPEMFDSEFYKNK